MYLICINAIFSPVARDAKHIYRASPFAVTHNGRSWRLGIVCIFHSGISNSIVMDSIASWGDLANRRSTGNPWRYAVARQDSPSGVRTIKGTMQPLDS